MNDAGETMVAAFTELVDDTTALWDPDAVTPSHTARPVSLDRNGFGEFEVNVKLEEIGAPELALVLAVARKYELQVCESSGWLALTRHYTDVDLAPEGGAS